MIGIEEWEEAREAIREEWTKAAAEFDMPVPEANGHKWIYDPHSDWYCQSCGTHFPRDVQDIRPCVNAPSSSPHRTPPE